MCGLAGFGGAAGLDEAAVRRMMDAIAHRGPDDAGLHFEPGRVGLGFRRLSIIDVGGGHQPLFSEDRAIAATCNGEIYNFRELRADLQRRGHRFGSGSDAEVLAHLYEEHGPDFVERLEGMFAIALWDAREQRLVLARDRLGVKPLYWARSGAGIAYASEPAALLAAGTIAAAPDPAAIAQYLVLQYVPPPASGFAGIHKLAPGEMLVLQDGEPRISSYWRLQADPQAAALREEDALERADALLAEATRCRLISDVPLGAFLSGGLDSSLVVGYMAEALPEVRTFSIDFPIEGYSEGRHARAVSELYGTRHEEFVVEPEMVPLAAEVARASGEPFADASAIPTYLLSRLTKAGVTVALSGDGGDEAFGGYERYLHADRADRLAPVRGVARLAHDALPSTARPRARRLGRALDLAGRSSQERYAGMMSHFEPAGLPALCRPEFLAAANGAGDPWQTLLALPPGRGINRYTSLDIATYLPGDLLLKVDRMSMAHALEVRSPMLDRRVHEFAAGLAPDLKLRRGTLKYLLKQVALRRGLPPALVHRRKQGFGVPLGDWFRGELRPWLTGVLTDDRTRGRDYFRPASVDALLREHVCGARDHAPRLWNLAMLELWHRAYIDRS